MRRMFKKFYTWLAKLMSTIPLIPPPPRMLKVYETALNELGVREATGKKDNPRVLEYHLTTLLRATSDSVPWCSSFVCWCLETSGVSSTRSAMARSYLTFGHEVLIPYTGCIVVLKRGANPKSGHVGFFIREHNGMILILGGNQGDAVSIQGFPKGDLLAYREI